MEFRRSRDMLALVEDVRTVLRGLAEASGSRSTCMSIPCVRRRRRSRARQADPLQLPVERHQVHAGWRRVSVRVAPRDRRLPHRCRGHRRRHPDEDLGRLFVEFEQLDSGIATIPGTGLASRSRGGSPRRTADASTSAAWPVRAVRFRPFCRARRRNARSPRPAVQRPPSGNRTVLVVEDDPVR